MLLLCLLLGATVTVGGGYATWKYAHPVINAEERTLNINLMQFEWVGSEDLPTDVEGQNHLELVTRLLVGTDENGNVIGLNNPNSQLNTYVNNRVNGGYADYFGSVAVTGGSEMAKLFDASTSNITFFIEHVSGTEYYIYTTSVYLGERGQSAWQWDRLVNTKEGNPSISIGEWVYPVYKTKIARSSSSEDWTLEQTWTGRAKSDWYDENQSAAYQNATQIPALDLDTWEEYTMGGSKKDAIWTFVGDVGAMYTETPETPVWYQIKPKSAGTVTLVSTNMNALIKVYNENNQSSAIASSVFSVDGNGENIVKASWNVSAGTKYYITIEGARSVPFTIS